MMSATAASLSRPMSIADIKELASYLDNNPDEIGQWIASIAQSADKRERSNKVWVLSHISSENQKKYITPHIEILADLAIKDTEVRRGLYLSVMRNSIPDGYIRVDLLDFCLEHIADTSESCGSRAMMIHIASALCRPYPELGNELRQTIEMLPPGQPPAIKCAIKNITY